ncbi:MAG: protein-disulfide reductase DsbD domain-containing protein [Phycisphaerales bacterium]
MNHSLAATWVTALAAGSSLGIFGLGMLGFAAEPQSGSPESKDRPHVTFRIISEHAELTPGLTETLGLVFKLEPHWHIYFKGAPGGGNPPAIDNSNLPKGYSLGEIQWPAPKRYVAPGGIYDSVYEDEVTLLVPLTVPVNAKAGEKAKIGLKLGWLECSDVCVFGKGEDVKSFAVGGSGSKPSRSADASLIDKSRAQMPKPWPSEGAKAELRDGVLTLQVAGAERLEFYPGQECSDVEGQPDATIAKLDSLTIKFTDANKDQIVADGILGVWLPGAATGSYFVVNKHSSK